MAVVKERKKFFSLLFQAQLPQEKPKDEQGQAAAAPLLSGHSVTTVSYFEHPCCGFYDGEGDGVGLQGQSVKNWLVDFLGDEGEELPPIPEAPPSITPQGCLLGITPNQGVEEGAGGGGGLGFWSPFHLQGVDDGLGPHNCVEVVHCARVVPCEVSLL